MPPSGASAPGKAKGTIVALGSNGAMNSAKIARTTKPMTMPAPTMPTGLSLSSATGLSDAAKLAPSRASGVAMPFMRGTSLI